MSSANARFSEGLNKLKVAFGVAVYDRGRLLARKKLARNVVANYLGTLIISGAQLLTLPFLVEALGRSYWGLVSFTTFMTAFLATFNVGLAQALVKEFGSRWAGGATGQAAAAKLLYGFERFYWCGALIIAIALTPFADLITTRWLHVGGIPHDVAIGTIYCSVALFFVQLPAALYNAVLNALQEQTRQNALRTISALIKGIGGVIVATVTHSALAYLTFIVVTVFFETVSLGWLAWSLMPHRRSDYDWEAGEVRRSLPFAMRMSAYVILGVITTQLDKFYVSLKLPIEQLGIYSIAYSIALGVLQVTYPISAAALPHLVEIGADATARHRANCRLVVVMGGTIVITIGGYFLLGHWLVSLWLGDPTLSYSVSGVLDWLILSTAMNMISNVAYINWVSLGATRWISTVNVVAFMVVVVGAPFSIDTFGLKGAAFSLIFITLTQCIAAVVWLTRTFLQQVPPADAKNGHSVVAP